MNLSINIIKIRHMTIYLNMKKLICVDNQITRNIHRTPSEKIALY